MIVGNSKPVDALAAKVTASPTRIGRIVLTQDIPEHLIEEFKRYAQPCNCSILKTKIILSQADPNDKGWLNRNYARIKSFGIEAVELRYL